MTPRRLMRFVLLAFLLPMLLQGECAATGHVTRPLPPDSRAGNVDPADDYEAALTVLLRKTVTKEGLVRYDLLRGPLRLDFRRVLKAVEDFDATALQTHAEKMAFWMNAYNVQMLQNIIETPEVYNIVEDGFADAFFNKPFRTARTSMALNEIENVILRRQDGRVDLKAFQVDQVDLRLHVGLNCAARSCPRLRQRAFTAATVDAELDAAFRDFVDSPTHFQVEGAHLLLSSLLDWYGSDFDQPGLPAGDLLLRHMTPSRPGYATLQQVLKGQSSQALKALPNVVFEYRWDVNRAH